MAARKRATVFPGIKAKLLFALIAVILIAVGALTGAGIVSLLSLSRESQGIAGQNLLSAAQDSYLSQNRALSQEMDALFGRAEHDLRQFAAVLGASYPAEDIDTSELEENLQTLAGGQQVNDPSEPSGVFLPNTVNQQSTLPGDIIRSEDANSLWNSVVEDNPAIKTVYFALPSDLLRIYPNSDQVASIPADYEPTAQAWYVPSTPENNPQKLPHWFPAHLSPLSGEPVVTISMPVYSPVEEFIGVVALDLALDQFILPLQGNQALQGSYSFLVDSQGGALGLTEQGYQDILSRQPQAGEFVVNLREADGAFTPSVSEDTYRRTGG